MRDGGPRSSRARRVALSGSVFAGLDHRHRADLLRLRAVSRHRPIAVWHPPAWTRHIVVALMWPASIMVAAAYIPGNIKRVLKHPMLVGVKTWAVAHLCANGDLGGIILFGSVLVWAVYDRITPQAPQRSRRAADPDGRNAQRHHRHRRRHAHLSGAWLVFHPLVIGLPAFGTRPWTLSVGIEHVSAERNPAAHRARHSRPQGRRTDRLPDLLSRAHRAHPRRLLRCDPGRRLARHGDARARDHGAGHARHDDPAGHRGDARLAGARWWWSTCRSAPTRPRRSRPSRPPRG